MKRKVVHQNSRFTYSTHTQQFTALFLALFALFCLTSHSTNEQTAEKCCIFAASTNESAQVASQEASITTKDGHNRRQAPVIYYDPKGGTIGQLTKY